MADSSQDVKKTDNPIIVFFVGVTAAYVATILPRLITYLSVSEESIDLAFFSGQYFYASSLFAIVIGISMVWLSYGKKETTRNLFMTALALPSVISGAINMSSTTVSGEASLKKMESQYEIVETALHDALGLSEIVVINFDADSLESVTDDSGVERSAGDKVGNSEEGLTTISKPRAEKSTAEIGMAIQFKTKVKKKNYVVVIDKSKDIELIKARMEAYSETLLIPDIKLKRAKSIYYIIQYTPRTKSLALIEVLRLNRIYGLTASVAKIN